MVFSFSTITFHMLILRLRICLLTYSYLFLENFIFFDKIFVKCKRISVLVKLFTHQEVCVFSVFGQLPPEKNCPPIRVGVWVKVRVTFRVWEQPGNCPRGKLSPGQGYDLSQGQLWGWGAIFLGSNCPRTVFSQFGNGNS